MAASKDVMFGVATYKKVRHQDEQEGGLSNHRSPPKCLYTRLERQDTVQRVNEIDQWFDAKLQRILDISAVVMK